jgi:hypothetical protein
VAAHILEKYLGVAISSDGREALMAGAHAGARAQAEAVVESVTAIPKAQPAQLQSVMIRVQERWSQVGYDGDYHAWIKKVTPADLP